MIFVLDTADKDRYPEAKDVLMKVLTDVETRAVPMIFLFHKMDIDAAKQNYNEALKLFKGWLKTGGRVAYTLKTSVKQPETMESIKNTIAKIVEKSRQE